MITGGATVKFSNSLCAKSHSERKFARSKTLSQQLASLTIFSTVKDGKFATRSSSTGFIKELSALAFALKHPY